MNRRAMWNLFLGCSVAVAMSAAACGSDRNNTNRSADANATGQPAAAGADRAGTPGSAASAAAANGAAADENNARPPVTLTGCLQKGDGRTDYILTQVNEPRKSVGTSGSTAAAGSDAVAQEQMFAAEHAYKLSGDRDTLEPLVGRQVRVNGTVERRSKLNEHDDNGTMKDRDRTKIDEGDLESVHVASIDSVAASCGGKTVRKSGPKSGTSRR